MCDEYTDISNKEQLSFCVRWVDEKMNAHEDFLDYEISNIKNDIIVQVMKGSLIRLNLPIANLRGQTYDGVNNMLGHKSGVAKQIKDAQPKALETHCHGHILSLSIKDTTRSTNLFNDVMGIVGETMLGTIKDNFKTGDEDVSKLCVIHWTVRATTFRKELFTTYEVVGNMFTGKPR